MPEPGLFLSEVASHQGVAKACVAKDSVDCWIEMKGLPCLRVGRLWKFGLSQIDERVREGGAAAATAAASDKDKHG